MGQKAKIVQVRLQLYYKTFAVTNSTIWKKENYVVSMFPPPACFQPIFPVPGCIRGSNWAISRATFVVILRHNPLTSNIWTYPIINRILGN